MAKQGLKLKQASVVLEMEPKELQNLVQFGVVKPKRRGGTYFFDRNALLAAKVAFCLKVLLGTRMSVLTELMKAFAASREESRTGRPEYVVFRCRMSEQEEPIRLGVPVRALGEQLDRRLSRVDFYADLPRGRKRRGWKKEFLESLKDAAKDLGGMSEEEISGVVRGYRKERRAPEIRVAAES